MKNSKAGRRGGLTSWLVEPYRQVKLGLIFLLLNLLFAALIFGVFGYYIADMYNAMSGLIQLTQEEGAQILSKFQTPVFVGAILVALFVITTLFVSIRYTHQIYGPLVSIQRFLDTLLTGKMPPKINLRSSDQLQELAVKLNSLAEKVGTEDKLSGEGPMVAICRFVDDLAAGGKPEKIKLRDGDAYQDLADKLNLLVDKS